MANKKWLADARQLLIDIERIYEDYYSKSYDQCVHDIFNAMRRIVRRNAKFQSVEVVHGRWEEYPDRFHVRCTNCRVEFEKVKFPIIRNYCPNCGADMR